MYFQAVNTTIVRGALSARTAAVDSGRRTLGQRAALRHARARVVHHLAIRDATAAQLLRIQSPGHTMNACCMLTRSAGVHVVGPVRVVGRF